MPRLHCCTKIDFKKEKINARIDSKLYEFLDIKVLYPKMDIFALLYRNTKHSNSNRTFDLFIPFLLQEFFSRKTTFRIVACKANVRFQNFLDAGSFYQSAYNRQDFNIFVL